MTMTQTHKKRAAVARAGEATGVTTLRLPFHDLWRGAERRFTAEVARHCCLGMKLHDPQELIDAVRLTGESLSLARWFDDYRGGLRPLRFDTVASISALASQAEDLAADDGQWREVTAELNVPTKQAVAELRRMLTLLRDLAIEQYGLVATEQLLQIAFNQFTSIRADCEPPQPWSPRRSEELRRWAQQLRTWSQPRSWWLRLVRHVRPTISPRRFLTPVESSTIERQIVPGVARAQRSRFDQDVFKCKQKVWDAVIGRAGTTGLIDELLAGVRDQRRMMDQLIPRPDESLGTAVSEPHTIVLVQSLDTPLSDRGRTVADLYREAIERAGCTATDLAAKVRQQGLEIEGRHVKPAQWTQASLSGLRHSLHSTVRLYLGSDNWSAPLDIAHPSTAFEHAAGITLLHPELRHVLLPAIVAWTRQSRPFAEFEPVPNHAVTTHNYLFCYEPERRQWEKLLVHHVAPSNAASDLAPHEMSFATRHPHAAVLFRHTLAAPCGALKNLPHYMHCGNLNRRDGQFPPLVDREAYPELRILTKKRPNTIDDAHGLLSAAVKAHVAHPIAGTDPVRFTLGRCPRHLERLFAPSVPVAEWRTAGFFQERLTAPDFTRFVEQHFTNQAMFRHHAELLAREHDAKLAAGKLVEWGIAETGPAGHYRIVLRDGMAPKTIPADFVTRTRGPLVGISEGDFAAALNRHHDLYNAVFWPVCDAVEIGDLSPNDAPEFLRNYLQSIG